TIRDLANAAGAINDHLDYQGWGKTSAETNPAFGDRYLYTAREFDSESGLYYERARYYDPNIGRWRSQDPLGFAGGDVNLYRYVHNGPSDGKDPSGLDPFVPKDADLSVGSKRLLDRARIDRIQLFLDLRADQDPGFYRDPKQFGIFLQLL